MPKRHLTLRLLLAFVLQFSLLGNALAQEGVSASELCPQAYTVGFFNGVWNSYAEAVQATNALREVIGEEHNGVRIHYETFYNHSGKVSGSGATMFQDVAEVFIQRAEEIEPNLADYFEIFWSGLSGNSDGLLTRIENALETTSALIVQGIADLYTELATETAALLSAWLSDPPTPQDYAAHAARIRTLAEQGNMLLLVAHSQGNLFVNHAYDVALSVEDYSSENVGVIHIAPASAITNGPHVLADIDLVINGLRAFGTSTIPAVTVELPISHFKTDPSGHTLIASYLDPSLPSFTQVKGHIDAEMKRLEPPSSVAQTGAFTVQLLVPETDSAWLNVVLPGYVDNISGQFQPPEMYSSYSNDYGTINRRHIDTSGRLVNASFVATCDADKLLTGRYIIYVYRHELSGPGDVTVIVSTPTNSDLMTIQEVVPASIFVSNSGEPEDDWSVATHGYLSTYGHWSEPSLVLTINVIQDDAGSFHFSVE